MNASKNKTTIETYNTVAETYQDKFMNMDLYNESFETFCKLIQKPNAKILDIACGPGNVTRFINKQGANFQITGIDLAPKMIDLAKANNPEAEFQLMDCKDILKLNREFEAIICAFGMPYLSKEECEKLIADSAKLLTTSGALYISTMEDDYDKSGFETTSFSGKNEVYIYYHQYSYLAEFLEKYGFNIIELQRKKYPEPNGTFTTDLIIIAKKK